MYQSDFRQMTPEEYLSYVKTVIGERYGDVIDKESLKALFLAPGHSEARHGVRTDAQMIQRCTDEHHSVSTFLEPDGKNVKYSLYDCVGLTIFGGLGKIADWMTSPNMGDLVIKARITKNGPAGYGYEYTEAGLKKKDTNIVTVRMQKNFYGSSAGCSVYTAYPDIDDVEADYVDQYVCDPYRDGHVITDDLAAARTEIRPKEDVLAEIDDLKKEAVRQAQEESRKNSMTALRYFSKCEHIPLNWLEIKIPEKSTYRNPWPQITAKGMVLATITPDADYRKIYRNTQKVQDLAMTEHKEKFMKHLADYMQVPEEKIQILLPKAGAGDRRAKITVDRNLMGYIDPDMKKPDLIEKNIRDWHRYRGSEWDPPEKERDAADGHTDRA